MLIVNCKLLMHAYLFIGNETTNLKTQISDLSKKLEAKILDFPLLKIENVRELNNLIRLTFDKPTLIVCENIHETGEEALNAFLKNLEEPQENIYFAMTSSSVRKVLPTIVSRCQVIKVHSTEYLVPSENMEKFFKMSTGEKLLYVDKIKDRDAAIEFAENTVNFMHRCLHEKEVKYSINPENIRVALKTLSRLKGNGNVNLQLSNFVINLN